MPDDLNKLLAAMAAGAAILGAATVAEAGEGHGRKHRHHHHHDAPGFVVVPPGHVHYYAPAPIVYAPRPVVVYPAPVMYTPAYPAYGPVYGSPGGSVNLGINLPLR